MQGTLDNMAMGGKTILDSIFYPARIEIAYCNICTSRAACHGGSEETNCPRTRDKSGRAGSWTGTVHSMYSHR